MPGGVYRLLGFTEVICLMSGFVACSGDSGVKSASWNCNVSLRLDSLTGEGSGSGASRDEALTTALRIACSKLNLDSEQRSQCERNLDFASVQKIGNLTIVTPADKSIRCSGSS